MKKTLYYIVQVTYSESDGIPFVDSGNFECYFVSDNYQHALEQANIYAKEYKGHSFAVVELKHITCDEEGK